MEHLVLSSEFWQWEHRGTEIRTTELLRNPLMFRFLARSTFLCGLVDVDYVCDKLFF